MDLILVLTGNHGDFWTLGFMWALAVRHKMKCRKCPECGRIDSKAGSIWGCVTCLHRYNTGFRWWDLEI